MITPPDQEGRFDAVILLALLALLLFGSPFILLWSGPGRPWYFVYVFWAVVILLGALLQIRRNRHDP